MITINKVVSKEEVLALTKQRAILTTNSANHICRISFLTEEDIFIVASIFGNLVAKISLQDGLILLKRGSFNNLTLMAEDRIKNIREKLNGRKVTFLGTDYIDTLNFNNAICGFIVKFGTQAITISFLDAEILLETGELPNLTLL